MPGPRARIVFDEAALLLLPAQLFPRHQQFAVSDMGRQAGDHRKSTLLENGAAVDKFDGDEMADRLNCRP